MAEIDVRNPVGETVYGLGDVPDFGRESRCGNVGIEGAES
jgi:hypothetical protein